LNNPELKETMLRWSISDNIWIRRVAIDFQQKYKDKTDVVLLEKIIVNNLGSRDYFISKSIGWSLRDYSKVNPDWVLKFIEKYKSKLDRLSVKEACKYLCKNT
jgi:3-methyladenine DNA glycosylase AlkD